MGVWDRVRASWRGVASAIDGVAGDAELGRDDLMRAVVAGIGALSRFGARGRRAFPAEVEVRVAVAEGSAQVVRDFLVDPSFERDLEAKLVNEFPDADDGFPVRRYLVEAGAGGVTVREVEAAAVQLRVIGGDKDGSVVPLPVGRRLLYVGRGTWHGPTQDLRNDVVLSDVAPWLSRTAARVERRGAVLVLRPVGAGDEVALHRRDGSQVRPSRTPEGLCTWAVGERAVWSGQGGEEVAVIFEEVGR